MSFSTWTAKTITHRWFCAAYAYQTSHLTIARSTQPYHLTKKPWRKVGTIISWNIILKRNVTWLNLPFNSNVSANIGHKFLRIIDKCSPPYNFLPKIFNRNTMKLSYSNMPNVFSIIASPNKHLPTIHEKFKPPDKSPNTRTYNRRIKESCPLNGRCLQGSIVYQTVVERQDNKDQQTLYRTNRRSVQTAYNNNTFRKQKQHILEQIHLELERQ